MLKPLTAVLGAALLVAACSSEPPPPAAPPPPAKAQSYLVFFDWNRSNLSAQALTTIKQAAEQIKKGASVQVTATGHTDTSGSAEYNMQLSNRRAETVKTALVAEGVAAGQVKTVGKGETDLLVKTADGVREPQNRRVEIAFAGAVETWKDPVGYCKSLSDKYRQYRTGEPRQPEPQALDDCASGDATRATSSIPILEDALIRANIPLPTPGYRWPGRPIQ